MKIKTMLFHTFLALILVTTVLTEGTEEEVGNNPNVTIKVSTSVSYSESTSQQDVDSKDHPQASIDFETSHKRPEIESNFQTSHKIQNERPIIKISNSDVTAEERKMRSNEDLMQMQKTELLLPSKEKPELNPVLSMLINEDIMKNIEARMIVEKERQEKVTELKKIIKKPKVEEPAPVSESDEDDITTMPTVILTTEAPTKKVIKADDDEVVVDDEDIEKHNSGLVDQSTNLEVAGSEQNKKSRIQIKKGPNGQDYEYEYVYYYYDEDEDENNNKTDTKLPKKESKDKKELDTKKETNAKNKKDKAERRTAPIDDEPQSEASTTRGKSRYTNIDRSKGNNANENNDNIGASKQVKSGRSSIPVTEDIDEERLPSITRFPPRNNKNIDLASTEATVVINGEKPKKKHHIKRPSLVDSDTFNTDDKQAKGNRNAETQQQAENKVEQQKPVDTSETAKQPNLKTSAVLDSVDNDIENTTPFMEKVAFDLYAILANENLNLDAATDTSLNEDSTTISADADGAATENDDENATTVAIPSTTTTTTTTTTEAPTTTTTTTTTTPAPLPGGKRGLPSAGRNRFRLKNGASTTTSTTETPPEQSETKPFKGTKNRFQRPSFGSRASRPQYSTSAPPKEEEVVAKEEAQKPAQSTPLRGKTRNRFNLRGSSTSTTEKNVESGDDSAPASTTARTLRARPTLNLRGRTRSTTTTAAPSEESVDNSEKVSEDVPKEKPAPTKSRFSLNRPGGPNRLAPRNRINPLQKSTTPASNSDSDDKTEDETTPSTLNKLKSRPKIQVQSKTETKPKLAPINRKVNPLLARRKLQLGPSTTEPPVSDEEHEDLEADTNEKNEKKSEETPRETPNNNGDNKDDTTVENVIEVSSEPPRGLGLLGQRRKLPLRKPGTIL